MILLKTVGVFSAVLVTLTIATAALGSFGSPELALFALIAVVVAALYHRRTHAVPRK